MTFMKKLIAQAEGVLFVSIMALRFAPSQYKLPGLGILYLALITAAIVDWKKNTKRVRRLTRHVATCGCTKARETIAHIHMPKLLRVSCTVCGAEST